MRTADITLPTTTTPATATAKRWRKSLHARYKSFCLFLSTRRHFLFLTLFFLSSIVFFFSVSVYLRLHTITTKTATTTTTTITTINNRVPYITDSTLLSLSRPPNNNVHIQFIHNISSSSSLLSAYVTLTNKQSALLFFQSLTSSSSPSVPTLNALARVLLHSSASSPSSFPSSSSSSSSYTLSIPLPLNTSVATRPQLRAIHKHFHLSTSRLVSTHHIAHALVLPYARHTHWLQTSYATPPHTWRPLFPSHHRCASASTSTSTSTSGSEHLWRMCKHIRDTLFVAYIAGCQSITDTDAFIYDNPNKIQTLFISHVAKQQHHCWNAHIDSILGDVWKHYLIAMHCPTNNRHSEHNLNHFKIGLRALVNGRVSWGIATRASNALQWLNADVYAKHGLKPACARLSSPSAS